MKNQLYSALLLLLVLVSACKKDETVSASGTFTAKFSFYNTTTSAWSAAETFTAKTVVTTKTGNDYVIVATDANANVLTVYGVGITLVGKYTTRGVFVKGGKTYNSSASQFTVTALGSNSISATFIAENTDWSLYDGKVDATF